MLLLFFNFISYFHTTKIIRPRNVETFCNVEPKSWKQISISGLGFWFWIPSFGFQVLDSWIPSYGPCPVDTGRKLNVRKTFRRHKTFRRRPGRLLYVLCTFNLRLVSTVRIWILSLRSRILGPRYWFPGSGSWISVYSVVVAKCDK